MADPDPFIRVSSDGPVGVVTLNRPAKRNAVNASMISRLGVLFSAPPSDWKAVVLAAEGSHFCAGLDLAEHRDRSPHEAFAISRLWHRATESIRTCGLPVVTALTGAVIGAGLEIAASTHIRIADASARYSLPEGRRGIFVGGGASVRVGRLIGTSRLTEMMLTGRVVEAEEGLRIGLSHRLVPAGLALEEALATARAVAENAALSNAMILEALAHIEEMPAAAGLFSEAAVVALTQASDEAPRRMTAFLDRKTLANESRDVDPHSPR